MPPTQDISFSYVRAVSTSQHVGNYTAKQRDLGDKAVRASKSLSREIEEHFLDKLSILHGQP